MGDVLDCSYLLALSVNWALSEGRMKSYCWFGYKITWYLCSITKTSYAGLAPCMEIVPFLFYVK